MSLWKFQILPHVIDRSFENFVIVLLLKKLRSILLKQFKISNILGVGK